MEENRPSVLLPYDSVSHRYLIQASYSITTGSTWLRWRGTENQAGFAVQPEPLRLFVGAEPGDSTQPAQHPAQTRCGDSSEDGSLNGSAWPCVPLLLQPTPALGLKTWHSPDLAWAARLPALGLGPQLRSLAGFSTPRPTCPRIPARDDMCRHGHPPAESEVKRRLSSGAHASPRGLGPRSRG